jgi:hypothetical protein
MMSAWSIVGSIAAAVGGFVVGWLSHTERLRGEIYTRRLNTYQELNKLASELLLKSIKAEVEPDTYREAMLESRLQLSEFLAANALLISASVGTQVTPMLAATLEPDINQLRGSFNSTINAMAHDLRLKTIDVSTNVLLPLAKPHNKPLKNDARDNARAS